MASNHSNQLSCRPLLPCGVFRIAAGKPEVAMVGEEVAWQGSGRKPERSLNSDTARDRPRKTMSGLLCQESHFQDAI
jgi:hypothetical protein